MKVVAVCGSNRSGNTEILAWEALKGAAEKGAKVEFISLRNNKDRIKNIPKRLLNVPVLVLASPNYFNNVSALMKEFIDAFDPYWQSPKLKGKRTGLIVVGGQNQKSRNHCIRSLKEFCKICKMKVVGTVSVRADAKSEVMKNKDALSKAFALGKRLVIE